ncbi:MAG: SEL1-like repeat protein [Cyanobacteria bacterium HKST-UBA02]|nr:SEL1-like repeat protein [Cyanobacteria bacterium HKST-UBA02]
MESSPSLPERYQILSVLGTGGMGKVLKVRDRSLDKILAVKVMSVELGGDKKGAGQLERFQQEARAAGRLKHENLVSVMDFGITEENFPYLVMEFIEGPTLKELIASSNGRLAMDEALDYLRQIASGMVSAHAQGVVHRDLKSVNIIVTQGRVKIIDFGIARLLDQPGQVLTRTNALLGSPLYMSPEQIRGERADERSDIYSFGCLIHECLTGRPPFRGATALETMTMHEKKPPPSLGDSFGPAIEALAKRCLAKSPGDRYQTMQAVLEDIEKAEQQSITGDTTVTPAAGETPARATSGFRYLLPVMAAAAATLGTVYFLAGRSRAPEIPTARKPEQNVHKAFDTFEKDIAVKNPGLATGKVSNETRQGLRFELGHGVPRDLSKARQYYEKGARAGDPRAMCCLGHLYRLGLGCEKNLELAFKYYEQAAEIGLPDAMCAAATMLANGEGTPEDPKRARKLLEEAAARGHTESMYRLVLLLEREPEDGNIEKANRLIEKAAAKDNLHAINHLGLSCLSGFHRQKDPQKARALFERGAELGSAPAATNLGALYMEGKVVAKDEERGFQLYKRAADAGFPKGQAYAGVCLVNGKGTESRPKEGIELLKKAVAKKDAHGQYYLGLYYYYGKGVIRDRQKGLALLEQAARRGNTRAREKLAQIEEWDRAKMKKGG